MTDAGNAERLVAFSGGSFRFVPEWKTFLVWDGSGVWQRDVGNVRLKALGKLTARAMLAEALQMEDSERRKKLLMHALASESNARIDAMVALARSEPGVAAKVSDLDRDGWLFNCSNGTLDLRTGSLRSHRREDMLTVQVTIAFDPDAKCPLFEKFLDRVMAGKKELIHYVHKIFGYCLTAEVGEECLIFGEGPGRNGKGVLFETQLAMMGEYGATINTAVLMQQGPESTGHQESLANIRGKRLLIGSELDEGMTFSSSLLKRLTGGDTIRASRKHEHEIEFRPTHKLILQGNHKPRVKDTSYAMWERLKLLPFHIVIPREERDKKLKQKLREELPGILAWAVRGCLRWREEGLGEPEEVTAATEEYRVDEDEVSRFLLRSCVTENVDPTLEVTKKALLQEYRRWCADEGVKPMGRNKFKSRLEQMGFREVTKGGGIAFWRGIRLRSPEDTASGG